MDDILCIFSAHFAETKNPICHCEEGSGMAISSFNARLLRLRLIDRNDSLYGRTRV